MEPCGMNTDYGDGKLPPGFRFHPTDEELVNYYLTTKVLNNSFSERAIAEVDLNKCEPWDLPEKAKMGEKEWYFFSLRDRKYPTGLRTNRATEAGYWKATGKDREVFNATTGDLIGMKKTLVFYKGRAPRGEKTNWVMHEYRLEGNFSYHQLPGNCKDEWVVCRIFHKSAKKSPSELVNTRNLYMDDCYWGSAGSLPPLLESPTATTNNLHSEEAEDISAAAGHHLINSNHQHHHRQASNIVGTNNNNPHFMNAHHNLAGISWQPTSGANPVLKALLEQTYNNASNNHNSNHLCMKNSSHSGNRMEENGLISPHWSSNVSNQAAAATHHGSLNLYGQAHASHCLDIQQPQLDPSLIFGVVDPSSTSTASPSFLSQLQLNDDVGYL